jgi:iron(III) transport system permease protein
MFALGTIYIAAIVWPAVALAWTSIDQGAVPRDGFIFSHGQLALLGRTSLLAFAGSVCCIPLAVAGGVLACSRRPRPLSVAILAAGLMCPPMVYSFGWLRSFPPGVAPEIRCVAGWVLWAWPVAAIVIAAGWARAGEEAYQAATLSTSPLSAFLRVGLPALRPYVLLAAMLMFVLFFGDYGMPHGFGLRVYSTELLAWASESNHTIDVLWPALLPVGITAAALGAILMAIRRCGFHESEQIAEIEGRPAWRVVVLIFMAAGWALPLIALSKPLTPNVFGETWRTYSMDLAASIGVAAVAAMLIMLLGLGFALVGRTRKTILFAALLFGALPGAVVGQALIAAYNGPAFRWLYDYWPIVSLAYVARYAWVGLLACGLAASSSGNGTAEQARMDGASESQVVRFILCPQHAPLLLGIAAIVIALAIGDVAASTLVRVPGYNPIAHVIIEKFHRFEDGMLISLSLMLVGISALGGAVIAYAVRALR